MRILILILALALCSCATTDVSLITDDLDITSIQMDKHHVRIIWWPNGQLMLFEIGRDEATSGGVIKATLGFIGGLVTAGI